ncbi:MAG: CysB family HTH-type transcriptional regulator [Hydrogenophaga sp.]|uniref:CysB family HTH-type transcriptional regulator n=1 Tax=Hydrogenophaga sp. TaxID=1904254 RepID=UPI002770EF34|nr:CysB family HTH-type transcriptional regulator [Hydrogenophaga sp.]MDP2416555.1 CysB family HTH-type transcriptional regulator [Hydrogenophaga sp.]MDZ4176243.1 CysB family HTH-type transcriptional regulator [Hydrogenophaga sp.]
MNFQQLRSVREAERCHFNLTEVAAALHTSQPGVSRQVRELEEELGVELFVRSGKRLLGFTSAGQALMPIIQRVLLDAESLRRAGQELQGREEGRLSIAATHSQARYALPHVVRDFRQRYPRVTLHLHQGSPKQVAEMLLAGDADIGVATEALASYEQLVTLPCYRWSHSIVVPPGHPLLLLAQPVTLQDLVAFPIITYEVGYTGRSHIDDAFAQAGMVPEVVLTAMDADVIKTYVELEMGVGIVASIAFDDERDSHLRALDAGHLFQINLTRLGLRRNHWLPGFAYGFIESFVPTLTREVVMQAQEAH